jgi:preprotein translocase subunit SecE
VKRSPSRHLEPGRRGALGERRASTIYSPGEQGEDEGKMNPGEFMRQVQAETRKVVWPSRQETVTTAIFVGIMMVMLAVFFLGIDTVFGSLVRWLLSLV